MSRKNQNNDGKDESLNDEQNDVSKNDPALEDDQASEDTIETPEDTPEDTIGTDEEIYEEIVDQEEDDVELPLEQDQERDQDQDQGFEQQPVAPMAESSSGGKGMAGTAMGLSLLALAGTGYNMYATNSSESADDGDPQQAVVDYSSDIASIQEQIKSLMQSQEELTAMAVTAQTQPDAESQEVEQVAEADESAALDGSTEQSTDTSESTATVDETAQADTAESATDEDAEVVTDEQAGETEAVAGQDQDSGQDVTSSGAETADTETIDTETADTETTDTETADIETADTETTDTETADTETTDTETTDTETADTETADTETADTETADTETTDTETADTETADTETADTETADTETADTETTSTQADTESTVLESDQPESAQLAETEMASDQDQQADSQSDTDSIASAASESAQQLAQQAEEIQAQVDALVSSLPSGDEIKNMAMEQVGVVLDDANKRLGLSEVAQLLSIGEQRLALAGDIGGAQAAFGMADQRLSEISDPAVEPVRESISSSLAELENLEVVDKNALIQELTSLSDSVGTLAFKPLETLSGSTSDEQALEDSSAESTGSEQAASNETQSGDAALGLEGAGQWLKSLGSKVGNTIGDVGTGIADDLKGMVTIQKTGALSDVMLAPEQQYFIREHIKLQLGSAQRAVLQDNTGVYKQSLAQAQSLLTDYFDVENEEVKSVSARLDDLEQINLELQAPDISAASVSLAEVLKQLPSVGSSETNSN